jgi:hypothetical protein
LDENACRILYQNLDIAGCNEIMGSTAYGFGAISNQTVVLFFAPPGI